MRLAEARVHALVTLIKTTSCGGTRVKKSKVYSTCDSE